MQIPNWIDIQDLLNQIPLLYDYNNGAFHT